MPKVSIILPSYNGEKYIAQSIQSVIDQTFKDWELIVVNDCSKDKTLEIAELFAKKDSRIKVVSNEINQKLPGSLNVGFSHAIGEYFTWTSDDNMYKNNALEKLCNYLDTHPDTDMVSMNMDMIDENGNFLYEYETEYKFKRSSAGLMNNCNVGAAFMYRRSIAEKIGEYDTDKFCAEDYDYWCRMALKGKIDYTSDNIYNYRFQSQSLTATKKEQISKKSLLIKQKYAQEFFDKYHYTQKDKALIWYNATRTNRPKEYNKYYFIFKLQKFISKSVSLIFFWNRRFSNLLRGKLFYSHHYSFSEPKIKDLTSRDELSINDCRLLSDDFDWIWRKIVAQESFALLRYGDGERALMMGKNISAQEGWAAPAKITPLGKAINKAYEFCDERVWHGISCPCCDLEAFYWYKDNAKSENLTFANIWVNKNFVKFKENFSKLNCDAVLIANHRAKGHKIANLNILKHYEIDDDCVSFYDNHFDTLLKKIKQDFGVKKNLLYVVSAGPLSEPLIIELFKHNPDNTYVDFGSVIDFYYRDNFTRDYMNENSKYGQRNCYMPTTIPQISVVLNLYKRPENLKLQIEALKNQSLKPHEILLFQDGTSDGSNIEAPQEALNDVKVFEKSQVNVGVWGRFRFALHNASAQLVCVFDDDTIPGKDWLANCYNEFMKQEGLYGTIGILVLNGKCNYPYKKDKGYIRVGWDGKLSQRVEVDFVGHSWFFKKKWLNYLFEAPQQIQDMKYVGEDMGFSYELQKHGIKTFVPPHPKGNKDFYGSLPDLAYRLGTTKNSAVSLNNENVKLMNKAFLFLKKSGWDFVYKRNHEFVKDVFYSLMSDKGKVKHYSLLKLCGKKLIALFYCKRLKSDRKVEYRILFCKFVKEFVK